MIPETQTSLTSELVLLRLTEPLNQFTDFVLLLPVVFAFVVLYLFLFFRQEESLASLLKTFFIPELLLKIVSILWGIGVFFYLLACIAMAFVLIFLPTLAELAVMIMGIALAPIMLYPLGVAFLATIAMIIRRPIRILGVVFVSLCSFIYLTPYFVSFVEPSIWTSLKSLPLGQTMTLSWLIILVPICMLGLVFVGVMYYFDSRTIHPLLAALFGCMRYLVWLSIALIFLLPVIEIYKTRKTDSKTLILFDVSQSMDRVDVPLAAGKKPSEFSRQAKIRKFLASEYSLSGSKNQTFLSHVRDKSQTTAYRFGAVLDDWEVEQIVAAYKHEPARWQKWLHPKTADLKVPDEIGGKKLTKKEKEDLALKLHALYDNLTTGTNISGAALRAAIRESGHMLQAVIIFSDGQSNLGSADGLLQLHDRAESSARKTHIITVGVGKYLPPVGVRVAGIQGPQQARPDDDFPTKVLVFGDGLPGREFDVFLDVTRVRKEGDKWVPLGFKKTLTEKGKFKGGGDHPSDKVEFKLNIRKLHGYDPNDDSQDETLEGYYQFDVRVPRLPGEQTALTEHKNKRPIRVLIQRRKLRVLLFASGPTREYQFTRSLFYREAQAKRVDLFVLLQQAADDSYVDQDVPKDRLLQRFPNTIGKSTEPGESLRDFDVIIAFDPDWSQLDKAQMEMIRKWVQDSGYGGGLIVVAGPINTHQLSRKAPEYAPVKTILPVKLKDSRLHNVGIGHDSSRPYLLNFPETASKFPFVNLIEEEKKDPFKGWKEFFWEDEPPGKPGVEPYRGFFNYYPVENIRANSQVVATFAGPATSRIRDGRMEMPYIVTMEPGAGRTMYIGSGEIWRLRMFSEEFHKRFWIQAARYVGEASLGKVSDYGMIVAPPKHTVGPVHIEALVMGADLSPLPSDARPEVLVVRPKDFDEEKDKETPESFKLEAKAKGTEHQGWFSSKFRVFTPGDYTLRLPIPGTGEVLEHDITIFRPDPETGNPYPDHAHLYNLATSALPILNRLPEEKREALKKKLQPPSGADVKVGKNGPRLYFRLSQAQIIPDLLAKVEPHEDSRKSGRLSLWDLGWPGKNGIYVSLFWVLTVCVALIGLLLTVLLLFGRQWIISAVCFVLTMFAVVSIVGFDLVMRPNWRMVPLGMDAWLALILVPSVIALIILVVLLASRRWIFAGVTFLGLCLWVGTMLGLLLFFPMPWEFLWLGFAVALIVIVGLLSLEWLCRKLLRLA